MYFNIFSTPFLTEVKIILIVIKRHKKSYQKVAFCVKEVTMKD